MSDDLPPPKRTRTKRNDWDNAWKEAIHQLFPAFLELLFPVVYNVIDWSQKPVFLEQELRQVTRRAKRGKGAVDKLVRVVQRDGTPATLLIHVEFQNQVVANLPVRLYTYNICIFALLKEPVITLAVLGDRDPQWRPAEFGYGLAGYETRMRFPIAKLHDYEANWSALEESSNPFAVVVMAHLKGMETKRRPASRLEWKVRLAKALYDRNMDAEQTQQLIDFIDWLMILDEKREACFDAELRKYEEERTVPILPPRQIRMIAREKLETLHWAIIDILETRFAPVPSDITEAVQQIANNDTLAQVHRVAVQIATLDEFRSFLRTL